LVVAQGAGALTRHAVGTPVFGGMIAASVLGIFIIPLLYITAESSRHWRSQGWRRRLRSLWRTLTLIANDVKRRKSWFLDPK
jgi:hypothetical protein